MDNREWNSTLENQPLKAQPLQGAPARSESSFSNQSQASSQQAAAERAPEKSILSRREVDVIEHIKEGLKNPEIAQVLNLSTKTVENHVRNILLKLGVKNRTQAVVTALQKSIISF